MSTTIENLSRPGQAPQNGDRVRVTITRADGSLYAVFEKEHRVSSI